MILVNFTSYNNKAILLTLSVLTSSVTKQNASGITNSIPLSNPSVSRHINEMAEDIEKQSIASFQVKQFHLTNLP